MVTNRDTIVMTHGFLGHPLIMFPLCHRLRRKGYAVTNWGYRSFWKDNTYHARQFRKVLEGIEGDPEVSRFHIVAHSMGNIVTRVLLSEYQPHKLQRIVMLCPPNHGSHVARFYALALGRLSTTLNEITDRQDSFVNQLDQHIDSRYEVGIVRASIDLVVPEANTRLAAAKDYVMLPGFHSSILMRQAAADQVHYFLQNGVFQTGEMHAKEAG